MARKESGIAPLIAMAVMGFSCARGYRLDELRLEMPHCPEAWTGLVRSRGIALELAMVDSDGRIVLAGALDFGSAISIPMPRSDFAAFLAEPVGSKSRLKPAGAVFPLQAAGGRLPLDFPGGWTASVAAGLLARDPVLAKSFNYGRLEAEAAERLSDPWLCPPGTVAEAAATGRFAAGRLKARPCFVVEMALRGRAGEGIAWLPESPYAASVAESAGILSPCLPEGESILYREDERLSVEIDAKGRARAFLLPD